MLLLVLCCRWRCYVCVCVCVSVLRSSLVDRDCLLRCLLVWVCACVNLYGCLIVCLLVCVRDGFVCEAVVVGPVVVVLV